MPVDADRLRRRIEDALEAALPPVPEEDLTFTLREAMRYSLLAPGKRLRPLLTLAFCQLCGGEVEIALPFACAIEMIHAMSLIHDDLPCMDDDDLRRGRPTNHKVYGEAMALLAGDGLMACAFETAAAADDPAKAARAGALLAQCTGKMIGGQCIDLQAEGAPVTLSVMEQMDLGKTVALIDAACRLGCIAAGAEETVCAAAAEYARGLGLAFQIRDDVLDVLGDAQRLGKNTGMDQVRDKSTYVSLLGVDQAQQLVVQYSDHALEALRSIPGDTSFLEELTHQLVRRMH